MATKANNAKVPASETTAPLSVEESAATDAANDASQTSSAGTRADALSGRQNYRPEHEKDNEVMARSADGL